MIIYMHGIYMCVGMHDNVVTETGDGRTVAVAVHDTVNPPLRLLQQFAKPSFANVS